MEYEKCYIYEPDDEPPSKKRRIESSGLHKSWPSRHKQFKHAWNNLDKKFSEAISSLNAPNVKDINDFLKTAHNEKHPNRIPTGIILLEPGSSSRSRLAAKELSHPSTRIITLESNAAPNLKTALKSICSNAIQDGMSIELDADADEEEPVAATTKSKSARKTNGRRLLAYDLEILQEYAKQTDITSFVIHLEDTEGFSGEVLSELVEHLSFWRDRLSIILLMNVSTSIDMLERRLTRPARSSIRSRLFPAATCEEEFEELIRVLMQDDTAVILGPAIIRLAAQRQGDYLQDIALIKDGLKYALMCAYFANPLIAFLDSPRSKQSISSDHCQALRNVPSFSSKIRTLLDAGETQDARKLLISNDALQTCARQGLEQSRDAVRALFATLNVIWRVQRHVPSSRSTSLATLYIQGLSGTLRGSASLRGLFLAIRKAPLAGIGDILDMFEEITSEWQQQCSTELEKLRQMVIEATSNGDAANGLTSIATQTQLKAVSELISKICKVVEADVDELLVDPKTLPFHEVLIWDTTSPYREVFMPRPRQAIERALDTPHDYLDCDCCGLEATEEGDTSASQPATAVLYNLYKESGNLINAHDAWQAFQSVIGEDKAEEQTMALFQRSLAELKHLGMVKSTRKRIDHIAKIAWPGL